MTRRLLVVLLLVVFWIALAGVAGAAETKWPDYPLEKGWSGPGYYLSLSKILACLIVFFCWVHTTDWVSRDCIAMRLEHLRWNPIVFGSFMAAFVLLWIIPWFWFTFPVLLIAYVAPLTVYIVLRNQRVPLHEKVLTREHLRYALAGALSKVGVKMKGETADPHKAGPPVVLAAAGGPTERDEGARGLAARQAPGFREARKLVADGLTRRADAIMVDFSPQTVVARHLIDGVWQPADPLEREAADPMLEALKLLCGANPKDRQGRQEGKFLAEYKVLRKGIFEQIDRAEEFRKKISMDLAKEFASGELTEAALTQKVKMAADEKTREKFVSPYGPWTPMDDESVAKVKHAGQLNPAAALETNKANATMTTQGIPSGERMIIQFEGKKIRYGSLEDLGMRAKMQEQLGELMHQPQGIIVFSALPVSGLRTTMDVMLRTCDRLTREFMAIEEEKSRYEPVENVPVTVYKASEGKTPADILPDIFHQEPQVLVIRDLVNAATVKLLCEEVPNGRMMITTIRARDAVEAFRIVALGVAPAELAKCLTAAFNQRLIRKLCEYCKEAYAPPAQTLAQLGIPEGRVQSFYRPPSAPRPEEKDKGVCPECGGIGYLGRTAIFELVVIDDAMRKALAAGGKPDALRRLARQAGMRDFQEEGILLVVKGVTSLQELMRVIKEQTAAKK